MRHFLRTHDRVDAVVLDVVTRGYQLLRKPFRMEKLDAALDKALCSGEFGQRRAC